MVLDYSELRDIQKRELDSSAIVNLPDDFYHSVSQLLAKKNSDAISSKSLLAIKEYENIKKIVLSITTKREEKIVLMAVRGEKEGIGLTLEEKEMLKELSSIIKKARTRTQAIWTAEDPTAGNSRKIRVLKDISQYRGLDNSIYGPFKQGDEHVLPKAEVEWLLKAGMAEIGD
jgi:DNA replication initiation complex subunit (GINS family)